MPLHQLPEELLLQIALHLSDSATPKHLKNLCLVSKKLRPTAQEALITAAKLAICCGCHPKVNPLIKLLRTILDRPDLANKVKSLRFRAVRKRIDKSYAVQGFDLATLRDRCISKLEGLGFHYKHPWRRSIDNSIESAFGGLLLALLPNLIELDCWVKDHQHGPPSSECISGLWGGTVPPEAVLQGWKNVNHLVTGDTSMFKCGINFETLTALDLRTISIGTVLRLNGPGSLHGAENIQSLALTISAQFADQPLVEKADINFGELLEALACHKLRKLRIAFINDGYHIGDDLATELHGGYFISQLYSVRETLEILSVMLETSEDDGELEWLFDMWQLPITSMREFPVLKSLTIPEVFLFTSLTTLGAPDSCNSWDLPPNLEQLDVLWPHEAIVDWVEELLEVHNTPVAPTDHPARKSSMLPPRFRKLTLNCREDVGVGAHYFTEQVHTIWWDLRTKLGFEAEVYDQLRNTKNNLATTYEEECSQDEDGNNGASDGDGDEESDTDDDMPDLEPIDSLSGNAISPSVAPLSRAGLITETAVLKLIRGAPAQGVTREGIAYALGTYQGEIISRVQQLLHQGHLREVDDRLYFVSDNAELAAKNPN